MANRVTIHEKKIDIDPSASPEEILAQAKEEGIELTPEQIEQVSGGWDPDAKTKPSYITQWIVCDTCNGPRLRSRRRTRPAVTWTARRVTQGTSSRVIACPLSS